MNNQNSNIKLKLFVHYSDVMLKHAKTFKKCYHYMINHTYFYFNIISSTYVHNNAPVFESRTDGQHSREPLVNFTQVVPSHNKHDMFWR